MSRFDHRSNYTRNAGINSVVIGSQTPLLEVELNEMQEIQSKKLEDFIDVFLGASISTLNAISYENETLSISECYFTALGHLIKCTGLSVVLTEGKTAFLKVKEIDVDHTSELKEEGNQQSEVIVPNNIKDSRYDFTTSKRTIISYDLVSTSAKSDGYTYIPIATIVEGNVVTSIEESSLGGGSISFISDCGEDDEWEVSE